MKTKNIVLVHEKCTLLLEVPEDVGEGSRIKVQRDMVLRHITPGHRIIYESFVLSVDPHHLMYNFGGSDLPRFIGKKVSH